MELTDKLEILADAAKYDASCASSGAPKRDSIGKDGFGATTGMGICHSYTPDGRCVSLLKILLTNYCLYDCQYCVNRRTSNVPRARVYGGEVVKLTADFYLRNYIDGLFLSSASSSRPTTRWSSWCRWRASCARCTVPRLHPPEDHPRRRSRADRAGGPLCRPPQRQHRTADAGQRAEAGAGKERAHHQAGHGFHPPQARRKGRAEAPRFAPAGQSTQMIVGADASDDQQILSTAQTLYGSYKLKRVYYSAFSPIPQSPAACRWRRRQLLREHRCIRPTS
jgi:predicted DNA-binding helix-hairpin-helix protein